jgi:hypothetical protein
LVLSDSNYTLNGGTLSATIDKAPLTLMSNALRKTYDAGLGAANASNLGYVVAAGELFTNVSNGNKPDSVTGTASYAYTDANAGVGNKTVTLSGLRVNDGNRGDNYNLTLASNNVSTIMPKVLTLNGLTVSDKVYDATTAASIIRYGSLLGDASTDTDNRYYASDRVKLLTDGANARFSDSNAGVGKTVTLTGLASWSSHPRWPLSRPKL